MNDINGENSCSKQLVCPYLGNLHAQPCQCIWQVDARLEVNAVHANCFSADNVMGKVINENGLMRFSAQLWTAVPFGVLGYAMFANPDLSGSGKLVYAYVTYSLMMIAYTVINVPYSSLLGVMSPHSSERSPSQRPMPRGPRFSFISHGRGSRPATDPAPRTPRTPRATS